MKIKINLLIILILIIGIIPSFFIIEKVKDNSENEETSSGALESLQFMSQIRAYPDADIPQEKFYEAFEYSKNNLL